MTFLVRCIVILLVLVATQAAAQELKIGYVNGFRIENESPLTERFIEQIKQEFAPREQQLQELQKQGTALQSELESENSNMQPAERQVKEKRFAEIAKQFEQMRRSYLEELEARKAEAHAQLLEQVNAIIKVIAETEKFDLILQQAVYGSPQIDITERVLAEMAKRNPVAEPAKQ